MIAETQRQMMVDGQIRTNEVSEPNLLEALYSTPREAFLPAELQGVAYSDNEVDIGSGRRLLMPMVLAKLIQALELSPGETVLDIAGGTGYGAALMSAMGAKVSRLESSTFESPAQTGAANVGALDQGLATAAPFDAILIEGSVDEVPQALLAQLSQNGRLVAVSGQGRGGKAMIFERNGAAFSSRTIFDAAAPQLSAFARKPEFAF